MIGTVLCCLWLAYAGWQLIVLRRDLEEIRREYHE